MDFAIEDAGNVLCLKGDDGPMRFHAIWLRDNALDSATRDPGNGQRLITMADLPADPRLSSVQAVGGQVECSFAPDGRTVRFPVAWLKAHRYDRPDPRRLPEGLQSWDAALAPVPAADLGDLQSDKSALRDWLAAAARLGFAKITGLATERRRCLALSTCSATCAKPIMADCLRCAPR